MHDILYSPPPPQRLLSATAGKRWEPFLESAGAGVPREPRSPVQRFGEVFARHYEPVALPKNFRDLFARSRRYTWAVTLHESRIKLPHVGDGPASATNEIVFGLRDILGTRTNSLGMGSSLRVLYKSKMLPMPPALARYALTYYASSLVRYKPQVFDSQSFPEQAYLFDAIARELALPMLQDVLSAILGRHVLFERDGSFRL